jgi:tryptophan-rich sensory protein
MNKIIKLLLAILVCEAIGVLGSFFTITEITTWYAGLNKPFFSPPNWVFGPVWTTLYALMGISIYLIWQVKLKKQIKNNLILLFFLQLFLNFLWSVIFFGAHLPFLAFGEIMLLWITILLLIVKFYRYSRAASFLFIPYLFWVSFASLLNLFVAMLNK